MTVIERAARALAGWTPNVTVWGDVCDDPKDAKRLQSFCRDQARAVLQAIREPSEGMLEARAIGYKGDAWANWQAMIDAALTE